MYIITAKTHLHAGSGNSNAGVIDNLVQRDPADNLPCIFASSLKGALREYFEEGPPKNKALADKIFGAGENKNSKQENSKGSHIFHQASLLSIPARSNTQPFFRVTAPMVLLKFKDDAKFFGINMNGLEPEIDCILKDCNKDNKPDVFTGEMNGLKIEEYCDFNFRDIKIPYLNKIFGESLVLMDDEDYIDLCSDYNLPIIPRNNLENGESKNLWYEQIVPRQARFCFFTISSDNDKEFDDKVNGQNVQVGANASIGYGVCHINKLETSKQ